jgi:hypothetical protein
MQLRALSGFCEEPINPVEQATLFFGHPVFFACGAGNISIGYRWREVEPRKKRMHTGIR